MGNFRTCGFGISCRRTDGARSTRGFSATVSSGTNRNAGSCRSQPRHIPEFGSWVPHPRVNTRRDFVRWMGNRTLPYAQIRIVHTFVDPSADVLRQLLPFCCRIYLGTLNAAFCHRITPSQPLTRWSRGLGEGRIAPAYAYTRQFPGPRRTHAILRSINCVQISPELDGTGRVSYRLTTH